ncbi:hypothetical protein TNCT_79501 [Trichonephila clavata]|uniref:Uncharacterized protein n=1 Tax=Trichonephila clavata TaxID=2740835 RepID=A0A8X6IMJ7_TRICU|nr:hypothetical protein TNCT_79501 [Trichonephila clavata]
MPFRIVRNKKQCTGRGEEEKKGNGRMQFMDSHRHSTLFQFENSKRSKSTHIHTPQNRMKIDSSMSPEFSKTTETPFCIRMCVTRLSVSSSRSGETAAEAFFCLFCRYANSRGSLQTILMRKRNDARDRAR